MQDFKNLKVWERAHQLTLSVYQVTRCFPKEELYGLTSQIRRASASIGANIAEGCGRRGNPELLRFLQIAMGSASELEYHLLLARDLNLLELRTHRNVSHEAAEVKKMLASLMVKLRATH
jgi:four helix bundle protein